MPGARFPGRQLRLSQGFGKIAAGTALLQVWFNASERAAVFQQHEPHALVMRTVYTIGEVARRVGDPPRKVMSLTQHQLHVRSGLPGSQLDLFFLRRSVAGFLSRKPDRLLRPGMTVIDLGSAPGSWSQLAAKIIGPKGKIVALDILPMDALADVEFLQGDFREEAVMNQLIAMLEGRQVDLVMSDMAPNISGVKISDQARAMHLIELALDLAMRVLRPGGDMLVKVFQGDGFDDFRKALGERFSKVAVRKPKASRDRSSEVYLLARGVREAAA